ncbi:MAG TPA: glycosyltransferase family 2 protein [Gemmatimonadota bacterium]|nr:glycosyltransferase family 2 protein [Gemmatimonadota bacterium]
MSGPAGGSLSVVIPTYGRDDVLVETVNRVLALDPPPAELLVVDQTRRHSDDVERELMRLSASGAIAWIRLPAPSIPRAMNVGLLRARSEIVLFLDDDVIPEPGLIAAHLEAHRESGAAVVAGQVLQPGEEPKSGSDGPFRFHSSERQWVTEVMGCNFSIRHELALGIGGMDENFVRAAYGFEAELCQRARAGGADILFEPRASIRHLRTPSGGTRAWGHHLRTARPGHSVGAFYRILRTSPRAAVPARFIERLARSVRTRHHRSRPWWIPVTLTAEVTGLAWAMVLALRGPRLIR